MSPALCQRIQEQHAAVRPRHPARLHEEHEDGLAEETVVSAGVATMSPVTQTALVAVKRAVKKPISAPGACETGSKRSSVPMPMAPAKEVVMS